MTETVKRPAMVVLDDGEHQSIFSISCDVPEGASARDIWKAAHRAVRVRIGESRHYANGDIRKVDPFFSTK